MRGILSVLGVLVVIAAIAGIVAYSQGWIAVTGDSKNVSVGVTDKGGKVLEDAEQKVKDVMQPKPKN